MILISISRKDIENKCFVLIVCIIVKEIFAIKLLFTYKSKKYLRTKAHERAV